MSDEDIEIKKELGRGAFGVTYLGYDKERGKNVAVKTIDVKKSTEKGADLSTINEEIETLKSLSSEPNFYKYIDC
jgi:serine/threonine protein kinase